LVPFKTHMRVNCKLFCKVFFSDAFPFVKTYHAFRDVVIDRNILGEYTNIAFIEITALFCYAITVTRREYQEKELYSKRSFCISAFLRRLILHTNALHHTNKIALRPHKFTLSQTFFIERCTYLTLHYLTKRFFNKISKLCLEIRYIIKLDI